MTRSATTRKASSQERGALHPRNPHQGRYNLNTLVKATPKLKRYITTNPRGEDTVDFTDKGAVLTLNKALLAYHYNVEFWEIPEGYLCPPVPGRADYIHYLADLLAEPNSGIVPTGKQVKALDIGTGANCIYPIIGSQSYGWQFTASDIDPVSVKTARLIASTNPCLNGLIKLVQQKDSRNVFHGIIKPGDRFHITLCNPPFYSSLQEAQKSTQRKWKNLKIGKSTDQRNRRNFGGQKAELWCDGGEIRFLKQMARESREFADQVYWFTSLVSNKDNLRPLKQQLKLLGAKQVRITRMSQGQKISHLLAWSYNNQIRARIQE